MQAGMINCESYLPDLSAVTIYGKHFYGMSGPTYDVTPLSAVTIYGKHFYGIGCPITQWQPLYGH